MSAGMSAGMPAGMSAGMPAGMPAGMLDVTRSFPEIALSPKAIKKHLCCSAMIVNRSVALFRTLRFPVNGVSPDEGQAYI
jgi:hypothetical protein